MSGKIQLLKNLKSRDALVGVDEQKTTMVQVLNRAFFEGTNQFVLILGMRGTGKTTFIRQTLADFLPIKLCIYGRQATDDAAAIIHLAKQLGQAKGLEFNDNKFSNALEFFRENVDTNDTIAIIVEDIDMFAHSVAKQVFLYTIYELITEQPCKLAVIGTSTRLDFVEMLEKRVKSRVAYQDLLFTGISLQDLELALKSRIEGSDEEWTPSAMNSIRNLERSLWLGRPVPWFLNKLATAIVRARRPAEIDDIFQSLLNADSPDLAVIQHLSELELQVLLSLVRTHKRNPPATIDTAYLEFTTDRAFSMASCDKPTYCAICEHLVNLNMFNYTTKQRSPFTNLEINMDGDGFIDWLKAAGVSTFLVEWARKDLV
mmetsp:Transcript_23225/g.41346  ORF Transcript_23225/g.41346 Transcript_23225/m.41346 type:complete len:373 (+) Transcript_23225:98-1216(+)